ncbi:hypothetical protein [Nonomuraea sp. NPDC003709]|uniref:hypothetical protein n=1 Tax=Nonomuraea sp. NPDC003709 TaxID=3154450 RepID=UPI0033A14BCD
MVVIGNGVIRMLIAKDVHILREALVGLLSLDGDITVAAGVASGLEIAPAGAGWHLGGSQTGRP